MDTKLTRRELEGMMEHICDVEKCLEKILELRQAYDKLNNYWSDQASQRATRMIAMVNHPAKIWHLPLVLQTLALLEMVTGGYRCELGFLNSTSVYLPTLTHYACVSRLRTKDIVLTHRGQFLTDKLFFTHD